MDDTSAGPAPGKHAAAARPVVRQCPPDGAGLAVLEKADNVLELLEPGGDWTALQIAAATDEPVSSTYRLLAGLRRIGLVEPGTRRGRFRLGLYAMELGAACDDRISLRRCAAPWLDWLRASTSATAFLMLRRGMDAVCVDRVVGRGVRSLAMRLGGSLPLYSGAGPRALLAFLEDGERASVLAHFELLSGSDPAVPSQRELHRWIEQVRISGVAISDEDVTLGIAAVGAPIFNHRGELAAALSVSAARVRLLHDRERTIRLVTEAAREVSRSLGCPTQQSAAG